MIIVKWRVVILLLVPTILCYGWMIFILPRLMRSDGVRKYILQAVSLTLTCLLTLTSVASYLNLQNKWYPTLESIFADPNAPITDSHYGAPLTPVSQQVSEHTPEQENARGADSVKEALAHAEPGKPLEITVPGRGGTPDMKTFIWLPEGYASHPERTYPVILGLSGYPGWPLGFEQLAAKLKPGASRPIGDVILVAPDIFYNGIDTECVDSTNPKGPQVESTIVESLIPLLKTTLRVSTEADGWLAWGYSSGGFCGPMLAIRHPDLIGAAVSFAGYFAPQYLEGQQWRPAEDTEYDLLRLLREKKPPVKIWFFTAEDDLSIRDEVPAFTQAVQAPTSVQLATVPAGGHRYDVWFSREPAALQWAGTYLAPFKP